MSEKIIKSFKTFAVIFVFLKGVNGIVNGSDANIEDYPSIVSVGQYDDIHYCGGALISKEHVLTAAHCVVFHTPKLHILNLTQYSVRIGSDDLQKYTDASRFGIRRINVHKNYTSKVTDGGDIAILTLDKAIEVSEKQSPAELPLSSASNGVTATALGWGRTNPQVSSKPNRLQKVLMWPISTDVCKRTYWKDLPPGELCIMGDEGTGVCNGDSGGPVYSDDFGRIIGVISRTPNCENEGVNYVSDPYAFLVWIKEVLKRGTSDDSQKLEECPTC